MSDGRTPDCRDGSHWSCKAPCFPDIKHHLCTCACHGWTPYIKGRAVAPVPHDATAPEVHP